MDKRKKEPLAPGYVVVTPARGKLPCLYVLQGTVGIKESDQENILPILFKNIFDEACELKVETIALPLIGTGTISASIILVNSTHVKYTAF